MHEGSVEASIRAKLVAEQTRERLVVQHKLAEWRWPPGFSRIGGPGGICLEQRSTPGDEPSESGHASDEVVGGGRHGEPTQSGAIRREQRGGAETNVLQAGSAEILPQLAR